MDNADIKIGMVARIMDNKSSHNMRVGDVCQILSRASHLDNMTNQYMAWITNKSCHVYNVDIERAYKVGDKMEVIQDTCSHGIGVGTILTLTRPHVTLMGNAAWRVDGWSSFVFDCDLRPFTPKVEPKVEPRRASSLKDAILETAGTLGIRLNPGGIFVESGRLHVQFSNKVREVDVKKLAIRFQCKYRISDCPPYKLSAPVDEIQADYLKKVV